MANKALEIGEKYLSVVVSLGDLKIKLPAFKNKEKKKGNEPDYRGNNIAVWVSEKRQNFNKIKEEHIRDDLP